MDKKKDATGRDRFSVKKALASGVGLAGLAFLTSCNLPFQPENNDPVEVYGPPSYWDSTAYETEEPETEEIEIEESETEESESEADESETDESVTDDTTDFDAETNIPQCVYGPPEYFK